jgi:predicted Zn-ribbon and HTH transcriptional regulator
LFNLAKILRAQARLVSAELKLNIYPMTCKKCGSNEWKYASVVHASGTNAISSTTVGLGVAGSDSLLGGDAGAIGIGRTTEQHQTELAKKAAPPVKTMRPAKAFGILGATLFLIGITFFRNTSFEEHPILTNFLFVVAPLVVVISTLRLAFTSRITKDIEEAHQMALKTYQNKKICMRCGDISSNATQEAMSLAASLSEIKQCPFCAETIHVKAILCKHCHSKLEN